MSARIRWVVVQAPRADHGACITDLEGAFPGLRDRLRAEPGQLRRFVNGDDVRSLAWPVVHNDRPTV